MERQVIPTEADILAEIRKAQAARPKPKDPDGAKTTEEWGVILGRAEAATRDRIRMLLRSGAMEAVQVYRVGMNGVEQPVRAYRLVQRVKVRG